VSDLPTPDLALVNARVVTCAGTGPRAGKGMSELRIIEDGHVTIAAGRILHVGSGPAPKARREIDAAGRVVMPGFVDCHTHACWAGSRLDEWERRLAGVPYLEILAKGGGIMSTVRSVRAASDESLISECAARIEEAGRLGTTTIEIKSGYGLSTRDELRMLRAIHAAGAGRRVRVVATALLGHAIDAADPNFVRETIETTLPAVAKEFPGITVDAFCEQGAWSLEQVRSLFDAAKRLGLPCRVHADQFNDLGMIREASAMGLRSVDHLEASSKASLELLASTWSGGRRGIMGVGLPLCGLHMADGRFADLRTLVDAGGACAIATNCNPGSAPSLSMPLAIAMAVRHCRLSVNEAIIAATANPAALLGLDQTGRLEPGCFADVIMLRHRDERALAYELGCDHIAMHALDA
jgi:imidazolonepropionase